jgi:hypothetical protein
MRVSEVQLFTRSGVLVGTVFVDHVLGKMPLVVMYAGETYALVDGRYVQADVVQAKPA